MTMPQAVLRRLSASVVLLQWFGNLVLILLAFAWLQIPDSHAWQFLFSLLTAAVLILAFINLHARTFRKLLAAPPNASRWLRLLVLLAVVILGYFLLQLIGVGRSHETLFAGYWNSKFSAGQRNVFTFQRLVQWQDYCYDLLKWLLGALLLPVAFVGAGRGLRGSWPPIRRIYGHLTYWLLVVIFGLAGSYITSSLAGWAPGHSTAVEIVSVLLRLGLAYTLNILLWCFVLALMAIYAAKTLTMEPEL
jgi:hypothetical protein